MTVASAEEQLWPWPDSLDALLAAPDHHRLLLENDNVRVLEVHIPPGEFVPVHTHRWPSVIFTLAAADFIRRDAEGKVLLDTRVTPFPAPRPTAEWLPPLPPHFGGERRYKRHPALQRRAQNAAALKKL